MAGPDSPNLSFIPILISLAGYSSVSTSEIALPSPPIILWSSIETNFLVSFAHFIISSLSIGFIGLAECLKALIGKHHGESDDAQKLGLEIIEFMRKRCDEYSAEYHLNFTLLATPAEGLSGRFVNIDKAIYGKIKGVTDR